MSLTHTVTTLAHDLAQDAVHAADEVKKAAVDIVRQVPLPITTPKRRRPSPVQLLLALLLGTAVFVALRRRRRAHDDAATPTTIVHEPTAPSAAAV